MILSVVVLLTASVLVLSDDNNAAGAGDGTAASPYVITDGAGLAQLATEVNGGDAKVGKYYVLGNDINLSAYGNWTPIGTNATNSFKGTFDGAGYTISGLYINNASRDYAGLFGYVFNGSIKDVFIKGASVTAKTHVGGLAGYVNNSTIENCHVSGTVAGHDRVGGVVGNVFVSSSGIIGCSFNGSVRGAGSGSAFDTIGGVAGWMNGSKISQSWAIGTVQGRDDVGGIVGYLSSGATPAIVEYCYFIGDVIGRNNVGGLIGDLNPFDNTNNLITKSYAVGTVSGTKNVGGIAGYMGNGNVTNCAALNQSVTATGSDAGRVIGSVGAAFSGQVSGNAAFSGMTVMGMGTSAENGTDINATEINTDGTIGGRFTDPWITENGKLPSFTATIEMPLYLIPKDITAAMFNEIGDLVYNGTARTPAVTLSGVDPKVTFTIVEYLSNVNAGTAKVTVRGTANYTGTVTLTFEINKATPGYVIPSGLTAIYGKTLGDVSLPPGWTWNSSPSTPLGNVGTHWFNAVFTPSDTANYDTVLENVSINVMRATVVMPTINTGLEYTGSLQTGVNYDAASALYTMNEGSAVSQTDKGSYSATFTLKDSSNYMWSNGSTAPLTLTWTIGSSTITAKIGADDIFYGDELAVKLTEIGGVPRVPSILPGEWDIWAAYRVEYSADNGATWTTVEPKDTGMYLARVFFSASVGGNYVDYTTPHVRFLIMPVGLTAVYDQTLDDVPLPAGWVWDDPLTTKVGSIGTRSFSATFTLSGTSKNFDVEVTRAPVEMPTVITGLVYNGSPHTGVDYDDTFAHYTMGGIFGATDKGYYYVTFILNDNYMWSNGSTEDLMLGWTIAAAEVDAYLEVDNIVYGDELEITLYVDSDLVGVWFDIWLDWGIEYSADNGATWTDVEPTDVGTYHVRILFLRSVNYNYVDFMTDPVEFRILPAKVTMPAIIPGLVYNSSVRTGVNYNSLPSAPYTMSGVVSATNVGEYTAVFILKDNYVWANGSSADLTLKWTIGAATIATSLSVADIGYGEELEAIIYVPSDLLAIWWTIWPVYKVEYTVDRITWTDVEPTDAGTYYLRILFTESFGNNYADFMTEVVRFTILPAKVTMPTVMTGLVYNGVSQTGVQYDAASVIYESSGASATNAGEYTAVFTLKDKNYVWANGSSADLTLKWTIDKAAASYAMPSLPPATYGDTLNDVPLPAGWAWSVPATDVGDVGMNYFMATFTPADTVNYLRAVEFLGVMVTPKPVDMPEIIPGLVYNGLLKAGIDYDAASAFYGMKGGSVVSATNKGSYEATFTLNNENYIWANGSVGDLVLTWTIAAATTTATLGVPDISYGEELEIIVYVPGELLADWWNLWPMDKIKVEYSADGGISWTIIEPTDAGTYQVRILFTESFGYNYADFMAAPVSFTIKKATSTDPGYPSYVIPSGLTAVYGQTLSDIPLPAGWTWNTPAMPVGNVGTNLRSATFTPSDTANYETVSADLSVNVTRAPVAIPTVNYGLVFDGSLQTGVNYDPSAPYVLLPGTFDKGTAAGQYTATFRLINVNYQWANGSTADQTLKWTIGQTAIIVNDSFTAILIVDDTVYGAPVVSELKLVGAFASTFMPEAIISEYSTDGMVWTQTVPTDVGSYYARVIFAQSAGSTYADFITDIVEFKIGPKVLTNELQPVIGEFVYNGLAQRPAAVVIGGLVAGVDYDISYTNNTRAGEATLTITGKGNYSGTLSMKFTISPKPITVTPTSGHSKLAGENDPTMAYAVSGLIGHDNLSGALAREPGEGPGVYLILLGTLSHPDYVISFADDVVFTVEEKIEHDPYASAYWLLFMFGFLAGMMIARCVWRRLYGEG